MNASDAQVAKSNSVRKNIFMSIDEPIVKAWKAPGERKLKLQASLEEVLQEVLITPRNEEEMLENVGELIQFYPGLEFNKDDPESIALWKDLLKAASPKNKKNQLLYDQAILNALLEAEMTRMLEVRNNMRHVMTVMGPPANKVMLLKVIGILEGCPQAYNLGSGSRCDTRRVILMYEAEAGVVVKKRKSYKKVASAEDVANFVPGSSTSSSEVDGDMTSPQPSALKRRKITATLNSVSEDSLFSPDGVSQVASIGANEVMDFLQFGEHAAVVTPTIMLPNGLACASEEDIRFDLTGDLDDLNDGDDFLELLGFGDE